MLAYGLKITNKFDDFGFKISNACYQEMIQQILHTIHVNIACCVLPTLSKDAEVYVHS